MKIDRKISQMLEWMFALLTVFIIFASFWNVNLLVFAFFSFMLSLSFETENRKEARKKHYDKHQGRNKGADATEGV